MMLFHSRSDTAHHENGFLFRWLGNLHHLEAAGQRGILLDMLLVFRPSGGGDSAQRATGERRLEQVCGITSTGRASCTNQGMGFVDEQDDWFRRGLHLLDHGTQALLEFTLHAGSRLQQAYIQGA